MKRSLIGFVFIFVCVCAFPCMGLSSDKDTDTKSPVVFLSSETFEFDPIIEGEKVSHDFIVENKGNTTLKILTVKPGCGCTAASYTKEIMPGESGKISLDFNSKGYGGKSVHKTARVQTNDPDNMFFRLTLSGIVESYAEIEPSRAILTGTTGDDIKTEIKIIPNAKSPFKITKVKVKKGENIDLNLKEETGAEGLQYILSVTNTRKTAGKYNDKIYLTTDSDRKPKITIKVAGEIQ